MSCEPENVDAENALREFLSNISCLDELEGRLGAANIFDVLGMARTEIRHSNVLAWLLDPCGTHGMGSLFLRLFLQRLTTRGYDALDLLTASLDDFVVRREYKHIDILLICKSGDGGVVVAIENKVDSGEHGNQLKRYERTIDEDFPRMHKAFVFLTPDRQSASSEHWKAIDYDDISEMLKYCMSRSNISPESTLLLNQYLALLEREFMKKDELALICNKIYKEHKRALDLIYEMREDPCGDTYNMICEWFKSHPDCGLDLDREHSSKSYIRFTTPTLLRVVPLLPDGRTSGWGSDKSAYYQIVNRPKGLRLKLSSSSRNILPESISRISSVFGIPETSFSEDWQWKTLHGFTSAKYNNDEGSTPDKGDIDFFMKKVQREIASFEANIKV